MKNKGLFKKYNKGRHWEKHPTIYAEKFVELLKKAKFEKGLIIDAGCGNGRDTNVIASEGFEVEGIDYSKQEIDNAKSNFPKLKFKIDNVEHLSFKDNSVSAIFCINVIHYTNKEKTINEFLRILKDKGYLFIHFNTEIKDEEGNIDYSDKEERIMELISSFKIIHQEKLQRHDKIPKGHTHNIIELLLQK